MNSDAVILSELQQQRVESVGENLHALLKSGNLSPPTVSASYNATMLTLLRANVTKLKKNQT